MERFSLTLKQVERLLNGANSNEEYEDVLHFTLVGGRLRVAQNNWSHEQTKVLMDKPY